MKVTVTLGTPLGQDKEKGADTQTLGTECSVKPRHSEAKQEWLTRNHLILFQDTNPCQKGWLGGGGEGGGRKLSGPGLSNSMTEVPT